MVGVGNLLQVKETRQGGAGMGLQASPVPNPCSPHRLHAAQPCLRIGNPSVKWEAEVDEL